MFFSQRGFAVDRCTVLSAAGVRMITPIVCPYWSPNFVPVPPGDQLYWTMPRFLGFFSGFSRFVRFFKPTNILHCYLSQFHLIYNFHFIPVFQKNSDWLPHVITYVVSCRWVIIQFSSYDHQPLVLILTIAKSTGKEKDTQAVSPGAIMATQTDG